jgi:hypothetical protein
MFSAPDSSNRETVNSGAGLSSGFGRDAMAGTVDRCAGPVN